MIAEARSAYLEAIAARVDGTRIYRDKPDTAAAPFVYLELTGVEIDPADEGVVTLEAVAVVDAARAPAAAYAELDDLTDRLVAAAYEVGIPDRIRVTPEEIPIGGSVAYPGRAVTCTQPFDPCALPGRTP